MTDRRGSLTNQGFVDMAHASVDRVTNLSLTRPPLAGQSTPDADWSELRDWACIHYNVSIDLVKGSEYVDFLTGDNDYAVDLTQCMPMRQLAMVVAYGHTIAIREGDHSASRYYDNVMCHPSHVTPPTARRLAVQTPSSVLYS